MKNSYSVSFTSETKLKLGGVYPPQEEYNILMNSVQFEPFLKELSLRVEVVMNRKVDYIVYNQAIQLLLQGDKKTLVEYIEKDTYKKVNDLLQVQSSGLDKRYIIVGEDGREQSHGLLKRPDFDERGLSKDHLFVGGSDKASRISNGYYEELNDFIERPGIYDFSLKQECNKDGIGIICIVPNGTEVAWCKTYYYFKIEDNGDICISETGWDSTMPLTLEECKWRKLSWNNNLSR